MRPTGRTVIISQSSRRLQGKRPGPLPPRLAGASSCPAEGFTPSYAVHSEVDQRSVERTSPSRFGEGRLCDADRCLPAALAGNELGEGDPCPPHFRPRVQSGPRAPLGRALVLHLFDGQEPDIRSDPRWWPSSKSAPYIATSLAPSKSSCSGAHSPREPVSPGHSAIFTMSSFPSAATSRSGRV